MSSFDISRIQTAVPLRETGAQVPAKTRDGGGQPSAGRAAAPGVSVETAASVNAGEAPVDSDRVAEIRNALKNGDYPLNPAKIADAIIAARLMLSVGQ